MRKNEMKRNIMKGVAITMLGAVFATATPVTSYAAECSFTVEPGKTFISGRLKYPEAGHCLKVQLKYTEQHKQTKQRSTGSVVSVLNGNYKSVTAGRAVSTGYNYKKLRAIGSVDGNKVADWSYDI